MGQKQGIEAATALLYALENRIKTAPQTFAQILDILRHFFLPQELVAQMKEQCGIREATDTQRPPAQSTHREAGEATSTVGHPAQSTPLEAREATGTLRPSARSIHHETREETAAHGPATPPIHHQRSGATATHEPPASIHHETRGTTVTQEETDGIAHERPLPPIHPGTCVRLSVFMYLA